MKKILFCLLLIMASLGASSNQRAVRKDAVPKDALSKTEALPSTNADGDAKKKNLVLEDLPNGEAKLRVEGASFRRFNLYLPTANERGLLAEVRKIMERDLEIVGTFNFIKAGTDAAKASDEFMKQKGAEGLSRIKLTLENDNIKASLEHKDLITGVTTLKTMSEKTSQRRRLAHMLAQSIFENFIGPENIFLLQIVAAKNEGQGRGQIVIMDFDGHNEQPVTKGDWLKSLPSFAPDGKSIFYVVNTESGQGIVEHVLGSEQYQFKVNKPGLNIDPRPLPDNSGLLVALSFENSTNIYRTSRLGKINKRVTQGLGLNYSPSISHDGKEMVFVSHRAGSPQIYIQALDSDKADRIVLEGNNNTTPQFSPDAKLIAFTGRNDNTFDVFIYHREKRSTTRVTRNNTANGKAKDSNMDPCFTPSGRYLYLVSKRDGRTKADIYLSSLNGDHQYRLTDAMADKKTTGYQSPAIKPKP